jgi:hypothetical protein
MRGFVTGKCHHWITLGKKGNASGRQEPVVGGRCLFEVDRLDEQRRTGLMYWGTAFAVRRTSVRRAWPFRATPVRDASDYRAEGPRNADTPA